MNGSATKFQFKSEGHTKNCFCIEVSPGQWCAVLGSYHPDIEALTGPDQDYERFLNTPTRSVQRLCDQNNVHYKMVQLTIPTCARCREIRELIDTDHPKVKKCPKK